MGGWVGGGPYSVGLQLGDLVDVAAWGIVPWGWGFGTRRPSNLEAFGKGFCILYSVICLRGNGVIHRGQKPASRR